MDQLNRCSNCRYYYVDLYNDIDYCRVDNQLIDADLSDIYYCKAFEQWFGSQ